MICKECGFIIEEGTNKCSNCGSVVEVKTSCPNCGASMDADRTICDNCGAGGTYIKRKSKEKNTKKICKYCKSEIVSGASVCPICKRSLSWKTNNGLFAILLVIVVFIIWGVFSNNAPEFIRETVCGIGIRDDYPYCFRIDIK